MYPDSLPYFNTRGIDYLDQFLTDSKVPCILSPCHNLDTYNLRDEEKAKKDIERIKEKDLISRSELHELDRLYQIKEGVTKKSHYHLLLNYGSGANKTEKQVQEDFIFPLNGKYYPEFVKNVRGAVRYLIHQDYPQKTQYRLDEVRVYNGFDVDDYFLISNRQLDLTCTEVCEFINQAEIRSYRDLEICTRSFMPWHKYILNHSYFFKCYIESGVAAVTPAFYDQAESILQSFIKSL